MAHKSPPANLSYCYMDCPLGKMLIAGDDKAIHIVSLPRDKGQAQPEDSWIRNDEMFKEAIRQLDLYFKGNLKVFDLPLHFSGTDFQNHVWKALYAIPYGETISYAELARRINNPKAQQAVGQANGANPIPIIIPCHRVINADESLGGFTGGLDNKKFLLKLEGCGPRQMELI